MWKGQKNGCIRYSHHRYDNRDNLSQTEGGDKTLWMVSCLYKRILGLLGGRLPLKWKQKAASQVDKGLGAEVRFHHPRPSSWPVPYPWQWKQGTCHVTVSVPLQLSAFFLLPYFPLTSSLFQQEHTSISTLPFSTRIVASLYAQDPHPIMFLESWGKAFSQLPCLFSPPVNLQFLLEVSLSWISSTLFIQS